MDISSDSTISVNNRKKVMELIKSRFPLKGVVESRIGGREENQDSYGYQDTRIGVVVVVCDGMGGMQGGKTASMIAVNTIIGYLSELEKGYNTVIALQEAISQANAAILQAGVNNPSLYGMGTTVTAMILNKQCATVAHVGDSRIYQLRGKKKEFRTFDHSMVFEMVKNGVMTEEQARCSNQSNIILQALGIGSEVSPTIHKLPYLEEDRFVLCSDGFWGAMPESEFLKYVTRKANIGYMLEDVANRIDSVGYATGGHHDNLTAAIIDVKCNSKMKVKMSKRVKLIVCLLAILLGLSFGVNVYLMCKINKLSPKAAIEVVDENSRDDADPQSIKEQKQ